MFEESEYWTRLLVDPPELVKVDLAKLLPPQRLRWGVDTPLFMRTRGVQVTDVVPAERTHRVRTSVGDEYSVCRFTVVVDGVKLELVQLVLDEALIQE